MLAKDQQNEKREEMFLERLESQNVRAESVTSPCCCSWSFLWSESWRSTWSPPPRSWHAAGGPRPSPSSWGVVRTSGRGRPRRGGCSGSCGRSPPRSGRRPAGKEWNREAWWEGLSKAAGAELAEPVACTGSEVRGQREVTSEMEMVEEYGSKGER